MREPITHHIHGLQAGDRQAAQPLWEYYFTRLVQVARKMLRESSRRVADEEDVALSAFDSVCRGIEAGRFPQLFDRQNLWRLLVVATKRKALNQIHSERRQKRGGGKVRGDSALAGESSGAGGGGFEQFMGQEPDPEFVVLMAEECRRLLNCLDDDQQRHVALLKMEGYTNEEIAEKLDGISSSTVERRLRMIRRIWKQEMVR